MMVSPTLASATALMLAESQPTSPANNLSTCKSHTMISPL